jgi:hypothetical protein
VDLVDSDLYAVIQYSDGVYLERIVTHPETVDAGTTVEMLVDRKVTEASCTVALTMPSGLDTQSTITLPYPINTSTSNMAVVGRFFAGNSLMHGQVVQILSSTAAGGAGGNGTLTVRGDLTGAKFFVGELYDMLYEFSTQYLKEQPPGGGMAVISGPKLQLRTWTMLFDKSSSFSIKVTPRGRDTMTYPYTGFEIGDQEFSLGELALRTSKFRVPVMAQNIEAKIEVVSSSARCPVAFNQQNGKVSTTLELHACEVCLHQAHQGHRYSVCGRVHAGGGCVRGAGVLWPRTPRSPCCTASSRGTPA